MKTSCIILILVTFIINSLGILPVRADELILPKPGVLVRVSSAFQPAILKGIKVHPDDPFKFDFILDLGDKRQSLSGGDGFANNQQLKEESTRLIKYFLASLTVPEEDLWVNLSPYEKDRIIPQAFGQTEMGRDLLAQDYLLKQITSSFMYPEDELGKKFWKRIYEEAQKKFGTTHVPVDTFNKVWIVPEKAIVYENAKAGTAYVVESKLKVMLEQDYVATNQNVISSQAGIPDSKSTAFISQSIIREVIIPELNREVNSGKNFAQLRQVYQSLILATWYKQKIRDSILSQVYADKNKVSGVRYNEKHQPEADQPSAEKIYAQYLQAFKKGAYNYIKEERDPLTQQIVPRKYFSGGVLFRIDDKAMIINGDLPKINNQDGVDFAVTVEIKPNEKNGPSRRDVLRGLFATGSVAAVNTVASGVNEARAQGNSDGSRRVADSEVWTMIRELVKSSVYGSDQEGQFNAFKNFLIQHLGEDFVFYLYKLLINNRDYLYSGHSDFYNIFYWLLREYTSEQRERNKTYDGGIVPFLDRLKVLRGLFDKHKNDMPKVLELLLGRAELMWMILSPGQGFYGDKFNNIMDFLNFLIKEDYPEGALRAILKDDHNIGLLFFVEKYTQARKVNKVDEFRKRLDLLCQFDGQWSMLLGASFAVGVRAGFINQKVFNLSDPEGYLILQVLFSIYLLEPRYFEGYSSDKINDFFGLHFAKNKEIFKAVFENAGDNTQKYIQKNILSLTSSEVDDGEPAYKSAIKRELGKGKEELAGQLIELVEGVLADSQVSVFDRYFLAFRLRYIINLLEETPAFIFDLQGFDGRHAQAARTYLLSTQLPDPEGFFANQNLILRNMHLIRYLLALLAVTPKVKDLPRQEYADLMKRIIVQSNFIGEYDNADSTFDIGGAHIQSKGNNRMVLIGTLAHELGHNIHGRKDHYLPDFGETYADLFQGAVFEYLGLVSNLPQSMVIEDYSVRNERFENQTHSQGRAYVNILYNIMRNAYPNRSFSWERAYRAIDISIDALRADFRSQQTDFFNRSRRMNMFTLFLLVSIIYAKLEGQSIVDRDVFFFMLRQIYNASQAHRLDEKYISFILESIPESDFGAINAADAKKVLDYFVDGQLDGRLYPGAKALVRQQNYQGEIVITFQGRHGFVMPFAENYVKDQLRFVLGSENKNIDRFTDLLMSVLPRTLSQQYILQQMLVFLQFPEMASVVPDQLKALRNPRMVYFTDHLLPKPASPSSIVPPPRGSPPPRLRRSPPPRSTGKRPNKDAALISTGGIDLTSRVMDPVIQAKGQSTKNEAMVFQIDPAMFKDWQSAEGASPVIINMQPILNMREFLES